MTPLHVACEAGHLSAAGVIMKQLNGRDCYTLLVESGLYAKYLTCDQVVEYCKDSITGKQYNELKSDKKCKDLWGQALKICADSPGTEEDHIQEDYSPWDWVKVISATDRYNKTILEMADNTIVISLLDNIYDQIKSPSKKGAKLKDLFPGFIIDNSLNALPFLKTRDLSILKHPLLIMFSRLYWIAFVRKSSLWYMVISIAFMYVFGFQAIVEARLQFESDVACIDSNCSSLWELYSKPLTKDNYYFFFDKDLPLPTLESLL